VNNFKDMRERQLIRKLSSIKAPKRKKDKVHHHFRHWFPPPPRLSVQFLVLLAHL
jgi:hypothetical protein